MQDFYTTYYDFHRISRRSSIYILITFRKGVEYLRNETHLLVRRNENRISVRKMNGTTFPPFSVWEFLSYQTYSKALNISGKNFNCQKHTDERREVLTCMPDSCFFSFSILRKTQVGVLKSVVSYIKLHTPWRKPCAFLWGDKMVWLLCEKVSMNSSLLGIFGKFIESVLKYGRLRCSHTLRGEKRQLREEIEVLSFWMCSLLFYKH